MSSELHSFISDVLHRRGLVDRDDFALRSAEALAHVSTWGADEVKASVAGIRTDLYRRHSDLPRDKVLELVASQLMRKWKKLPGGDDPIAPARIVKVLFIAANPINDISPGISTRPLALDEEMREIQQKITASKHRDSFELVMRMAARPDDLLQAFNEIQPHVVHFSGHGTDTDELVLLNDQRQPQLVSKPAISALFRTMKDNIRVAVLNACFSEGQAAAITKYVDCAIGMKQEIGDDAAIKFAASFYRAIGFGRSVQAAFDQGITAIGLAGINETLTPKLLHRDGVDPSKVRLI